MEPTICTKCKLHNASHTCWTLEKREREPEWVPYWWYQLEQMPLAKWLTSLYREQRIPIERPSAFHKRYLCCNCYVEEGNAPADWHIYCMIAYNKKRTKEKK